MDSRHLSVDARRFLGHLVLLGSSSVLAVGLLPDRAHARSPAGRSQEGVHGPHGRDTTGVGALFPPGPWCPVSAGSTALTDRGHDGIPCPGPSSPRKPALSVRRRDDASSRGHGWSPCPSSPGPVWRMGRPFLRRYPALRTPPLPATHVGMGDRRRHAPDGRLSSATLIQCDLVSHSRCAECLQDMPSSATHAPFVSLEVPSKCALTTGTSAALMVPLSFLPRAARGTVRAHASFVTSATPRLRHGTATVT